MIIVVRVLLLLLPLLIFGAPHHAAAQSTLDPNGIDALEHGVLNHCSNGQISTDSGCKEPATVLANALNGNWKCQMCELFVSCADYGTKLSLGAYKALAPFCIKLMRLLSMMAILFIAFFCKKFFIKT